MNKDLLDDLLDAFNTYIERKFEDPKIEKLPDDGILDIAYSKFGPNEEIEAEVKYDINKEKLYSYINGRIVEEADISVFSFIHKLYLKRNYDDFISFVNDYDYDPQDLLETVNEYYASFSPGAEPLTELPADGIINIQQIELDIYCLDKPASVQTDYDIYAMEYVHTINNSIQYREACGPASFMFDLKGKKFIPDFDFCYGLDKWIEKNAVLINPNIRNKMLSELVEAGKWKVSEPAFRLFQDNKPPNDVGFIASVEYGNRIYKFIARDYKREIDPQTGKPDKYLVNYEVYGPELYSFEYETLEFLEPLEFKNYFRGYSDADIVAQGDPQRYPQRYMDSYISRDDENIQSIEKFKESAVKKLLKDEHLFIEKLNEYKECKEKRLSYWDQLPVQKKNSLKRLSSKQKLRSVEIEGIARYYADKVFVSDQTIILDMIKDGFSDSRINMISMEMDRLAGRIPQDMTAVLKSEAIKDYRKNIEIYNKIGEFKNGNEYHIR